MTKSNVTNSQQVEQSATQTVAPLLALSNDIATHLILKAGAEKSALAGKIIVSKGAFLLAGLDFNQELDQLQKDDTLQPHLYAGVKVVTNSLLYLFMPSSIGTTFAIDACVEAIFPNLKEYLKAFQNEQRQKYIYQNQGDAEDQLMLDGAIDMFGGISSIRKLIEKIGPLFAMKAAPTVKKKSEIQDQSLGIADDDNSIFFEQTDQALEPSKQEIITMIKNRKNNNPVTDNWVHWHMSPELVGVQFGGNQTQYNINVGLQPTADFSKFVTWTFGCKAFEKKVDFMGKEYRVEISPGKARLKGKDVKIIIEEHNYDPETKKWSWGPFKEKGMHLEHGRFELSAPDEARAMEIVNQKMMEKFNEQHRDGIKNIQAEIRNSHPEKAEEHVAYLKIYYKKAPKEFFASLSDPIEIYKIEQAVRENRYTDAKKRLDQIQQKEIQNWLRSAVQKSEAQYINKTNKEHDQQLIAKITEYLMTEDINKARILSKYLRDPSTKEKILKGIELTQKSFEAQIQSNVVATNAFEVKFASFDFPASNIGDCFSDYSPDKPLSEEFQKLHHIITTQTGSELANIKSDLTLFLKDNQHTYEANVLLSLWAFKHGHYVDALRQSMHLLKKNPNDINLLAIKGACQLRLGYSELGRQNLMVAFQKNPEDSFINQVLIESYRSELEPLMQRASVLERQLSQIKTDPVLHSNARELYKLLKHPKLIYQDMIKAHILLKRIEEHQSKLSTDQILDKNDASASKDAQKLAEAKPVTEEDIQKLCEERIKILEARFNICGIETTRFVFWLAMKAIGLMSTSNPNEKADVEQLGASLLSLIELHFYTQLEYLLENDPSILNNSMTSNQYFQRITDVLLATLKTFAPYFSAKQQKDYEYYLKNLSQMLTLQYVVMQLGLVIYHPSLLLQNPIFKSPQILLGLPGSSQFLLKPTANDNAAYYRFMLGKFLERCSNDNLLGQLEFLWGKKSTIQSWVEYIAQNDSVEWTANYIYATGKWVWDNTGIETLNKIIWQSVVLTHDNLLHPWGLDETISKTLGVMLDPNNLFLIRLTNALIQTLIHNQTDWRNHALTQMEQDHQMLAYSSYWNERFIEYGKTHYRDNELEALSYVRALTLQLKYNEKNKIPYQKVEKTRCVLDGLHAMLSAACSNQSDKEHQIKRQSALNKLFTELKQEINSFAKEKTAHHDVNTINKARNIQGKMNEINKQATLLLSSTTDLSHVYDIVKTLEYTLLADTAPKGSNSLDKLLSVGSIAPMFIFKFPSCAGGVKRSYSEPQPHDLRQYNANSQAGFFYNSTLSHHVKIKRSLFAPILPHIKGGNLKIGLAYTSALIACFTFAKQTLSGQSGPTLKQYDAVG